MTNEMIKEKSEFPQADAVLNGEMKVSDYIESKLMTKSAIRNEIDIWLRKYLNSAIEIAVRIPKNIELNQEIIEQFKERIKVNAKDVPAQEGLMGTQGLIREAKMQLEAHIDRKKTYEEIIEQLREVKNTSFRKSIIELGRKLMRKIFK